MWRADRVLGLVTVGLAIGLAVASRAIEINEAQLTLSARFFPLTLSTALFGLGVLLALRPGEQRLAEVIDLLLVRRALLLAAVTLIYFLGFRYIDFRVGAWLFMVAAMWSLGARRPWELIVIPPVVAAAVYAVFRYGFTVLLPTWI